MSDLLAVRDAKPAPPEIPEQWDFEQADKDFDELIYGWRRLTLDVISVLWIFYQKLKAQGRRNDLSTNVEKLPPWIDWIESKGIASVTALRHFKVLGWLSPDTLVSKFTGNQENYTPEYIIEAARAVMGSIDLDPASCEYAQKTVKAEEYFTEEDDGLELDWHGNVFLNPPYKMPLIEQFIDKLIEELPNLRAAILLTNNNTDTKWFHRAAKKAKVICFTEGRIHFYTSELEETQPTNGQALFYFGHDEPDFIQVFDAIGNMATWL